MTPVAWLLLALTAAVLVAGLLIAAAVRQAGVHLENLSHLDHMGNSAQRNAIANEKAADDRPAQQQATKYLDLSEKLIVGISEVLNHELEHPEGLKDDVIVGRNQGAEIVKELLQNELVNAQK